MSPALETFRAVTRRNPPRVLREEVEAALGESPDVEFLERCYKSWCAAGYRPTNLAWLFEWYQSRRLPVRAVEIRAERTRPPVEGGPRINEDERMSWPEILALCEAREKGSA